MKKGLRGYWVRGLIASVGLLGLVLGTFYAAVSYRPSFYHAPVVAPAVRQEYAEEFVERSLQLRNDAMNETRWEAVFSDAQINAWLAEDFVTQFADVLPSGVEDPRVVFDTDKLTVAFTYHEGLIHSVVWATLRVSVDAEKEIALELESLRAGMIPLPDSMLTEKLDRLVGGTTMSLTWTREGSNTVGKLRHDSRKSGRQIRIDSLLLAPGWIKVAGRSAAGEATLSQTGLYGRMFRLAR